MASFEVVAMALAPWRHLAIFSEYYLRMGANRVRIFFDGMLENEDHSHDYEVIECNEQFWINLGVRRPAIVEDRQRAIYGLAYLTATSDWILIVDIDEFVFGDVSLLDAFRIAGDNNYDCIRFSSAEAVFGEGDDISKEYGARFFRKSYNKYLAAILPHFLYPGLGHVFIRGLLGHAIGKQAVRSGIRNISLNIHHAHCEGKLFREFDISSSSPGRRLLLAHYDAISFDQWSEKWERRLSAQDTAEMGSKRKKQFDLYIKAAMTHNEEILFRRLYSINTVQLGVLRALNLVVDDTYPDLDFESGR
jgi:hypothetical protein